MTATIFERGRGVRLAVAVMLLAVVATACQEMLASGESGDGAPSWLVIVPESVIIVPNDSVEFIAVAFTQSGDTADVDVAWSATGGTITPSARGGQPGSGSGGGGGQGKRGGWYKNGKCGDYQVTATTVPGDISARASVRVSCTEPGPVATVTVRPETAALQVGESVQLAVEVTDANGIRLTGRTTTWTPSDPSVASVDQNGLVRGEGEGSATITATADGVSGSAAIAVFGQGTRIVFSESNEDFPNPERGTLKNTRFFPDRTDFSTSHESAESMIWVYYMLENYRDRPLDSQALARISGTFDEARAAGLKIIPLFTYNFAIGEPDAPLSQVLEHIGQLKPILQAQSDVISLFQLGFVGAWGEWHSSTNNLTDPSSQRAIIDATLDALPAGVPISLRYPRDKKEHFGGPLSESEAFSGSAAARIGHHNHCFLASDDDEGTYRSAPREGASAATIEEWKAFIAEEGRFLPVGGETCEVNPPRSLCPVALAELERLHWSWINRSFHPDVIDGWVAGGCMDTIRRRLGYRIVLREARVPPAVRGGEQVAIEVVLENVGYAAMYRDRPVYFVLAGEGNRYEFDVPSVDPRRWEPGTQHSIRASLLIPQSVPAGTYSLSLWLPDRAASLRDRPEYAVRFANQGVWDAATGLNILVPDLQVE